MPGFRVYRYGHRLYLGGIILSSQYPNQDVAMRICACIGVAGSLAIVLLPAEISIWAIF